MHVERKAILEHISTEKKPKINTEDIILLKLGDIKRYHDHM